MAGLGLALGLAVLLAPVLAFLQSYDRGEVDDTWSGCAAVGLHCLEKDDHRLLALSCSLKY